ncbi:MAG: hypothetical protein JXR23_07615 [Pontiellaceae bacterium]|nr:hypothetical protein [Pontiellaceae bacterium]
MKKGLVKTVVAGSILLYGLSVQADPTWSASTVLGFAELGNSSKDAESVQGWYFSSTRGTSSQTINGINFTGLNIGTEETGSNGVLSWNGANGYDLTAPDWGDAARNAVSVGGVHGGGSDLAMSFSFSMEAGKEYVIEMVSIQPSYFGKDRHFDLAVDGELLIHNYWVPYESPHNNHVIIRGISDGSIDLLFTAGSTTDDTNPAISLITVAEAIPEPAVASFIGLFGVGALVVRRFFMK